MDPISRRDLRQLAGSAQEPCVSIYFPTHRAGVDTLQDPIRLKNLLREAERQLGEQGESVLGIRELLRPLRELVDQYEFWQHQSDGLALFRSRDVFRQYRIPFPVPELAVVARRFHLKPLLFAMESNQRFSILALCQDSAKLYEGNSQQIAEVDVPEMPESPIDSPGERGAERLLASHTADRGSSGKRGAIFHGHGQGADDRKQVLLAHFRRVDEAVRNRLNGEHLPLVLAAVDYLCPIYRQASSNPDLLAAEVHGNPESFTLEELHGLALAVTSSYFRDLRNMAADEYHQLWHTRRASNELPDIVVAAREGRVKVLFVAVGIQEWGHVDPLSAEVVQGERNSPPDQDLLNVAAIETYIAGGTVYAVPPDEVPGHGTIAAVFRY